MNTTKLAYLSNPNLFRLEASMTELGTDERGSFIITDITPAYPQGGGQEADNGFLILNSEKIEFNDVRIIDGVLKHYIPIDFEKVEAGAIIEISVDENRRKRNSILHTAGHLLASVAFKTIHNLIPSKGHHFMNGSYIELQGEYNDNIEETKLHLQRIVNEEIQTAKCVTLEMVTFDELKEKCPFIQAGITSDKPLRVVNIESYFPMGCGGTHVEKLNEIPVLNITKVKFSKGILRISYNCF